MKDEMSNIVVGCMSAALFVFICLMALLGIVERYDAIQVALGL